MSRLRSLLSSLRALAPGLIETDGRHLVLASALDADHLRFETALERRDTCTAVSLYSGDFLSGITGPDTQAFDSWLAAQRDILRRAFLSAAGVEFDTLLARQALNEARQVAARTRDAHPDCEEGWQLVLRGAIAAHDAPAAESAVSALLSHFSLESLPLSEETRTLIRLCRALTTDQPATGERTGRPVFVGRRAELGTLLAAWSHAEQGPGQHLHLEGAAGIGKSSLLDAFQRHLLASGGRAIRLGARRHGRPLPYALASELALQLASLPGASGVSQETASVLVALHPALSSAFRARADARDGVEGLRRRSLAIAELASVVAEEAPIAILIDDVDACDEPSQAIAYALATASSQTDRLLVLTTSRPAPSERRVHAVATLLPVPALSTRDVEALLRARGISPSAADISALVEGILEVSHGIGREVERTVAALIESGHLAPSDGPWVLRDSASVNWHTIRDDMLRSRIAELEPPEQRALALLSVFDAPIAPHAIEALPAPHSLHRSLESLRTASLVELDERGWTLSDPDLGRAAARTVSPDDIASACRAIRGYLVEIAGDAPHHAPESYAVLMGAGDTIGASRIARAFVRHARRSGDVRPPHAVLGDLLSTEDGHSRQTLVRSLPWRERLGLFTRARRIAALVTAFVATVGISLPMLASVRRSHSQLNEGDAELVIALEGADSVIRIVPRMVSESDWRAGKPLTFDPDGNDVIEADPRFSDATDFDARTGAWILSTHVSDSGTIDVFSLPVGGAPKRMTRERGDDLHARLSPDARWIVTQSESNSRLSRYDIALRDSTWRVVRWLTSGDAQDVTPVWSPEGDRIAFVRRHFRRDSSDELCSVSLSGDALRCVTPGISIRDLHAWNDRGILGQHIQDGVVSLAVVSPLDGAARVLVRGDTSEAGRGSMVVSNDGEWVACLCAGAQGERGTWYVAPTRRPDLMRPLLSERLDTRVAFVRWRALHRRSFIESVEIDPLLGDPIVGVPHQLHAVARRASGEHAMGVRLRWHSSNPEVATIDADRGILFPRRSGQVRITASVGGSRETSISLGIRESHPARLALDESWAQGWESRWLSFGSPSPGVVDSGAMSYLHLAGDSSSSSGMISRQMFSGAGGLTIDARMRAPANIGQWQWIGVQLLSGLPSIPLASSIAEEPSERGYAGRCQFTFPGGVEGPYAADSITIESPARRVVMPAPRSMATGRWFDLRVQLYPDGRCALWIDGTYRTAVPSSIRAGDSLRLMLKGQSYETSVAAERVSVRTGLISQLPPDSAVRATSFKGRG